MTNDFSKGTKISRRALLAAAGGTVCTAYAGLVMSQPPEYPNKLVRVIVPYPPGGPTDIVSRVICNGLSTRLKQAFTVENRPGASGMIGADVIAKAPPDGYNLLINVSGHIVNPALYAKMTHDPLKDFKPITNLAVTPIVLVVSANSDIHSVADLIKTVRAQPGRHGFASSSSGTPGHLTGEVFKGMHKLDVQHIPYKGAAPALTDLIGGQVTFMFDSMPSSINLIKGGKLRALGVTSKARLGVLPDLPTFEEIGMPEINLTTWYGFWAPARTPDEIVNRLYQETSQLLQSPEVKAKLHEVQADPVGDTPANFAAFCVAEARRYAAIVQQAHIKLG